MNKIFFAFYCVICLLIVEKEMAWSPDYKLQWSDFQGTPNNNSDAAATTASGITFGYRLSETDGNITDFAADVTAHFYPDKSWYKPEEVSNHILEHEQLHFDITELHARKLRQQISELSISNSVGSKLDALHLQILQDLSTMQNNYDAASDFSRNREQQKLWKDNITEQLNALNSFAKLN